MRVKNNIKDREVSVGSLNKHDTFFDLNNDTLYAVVDTQWVNIAFVDAAYNNGNRVFVMNLQNHVLTAFNKDEYVLPVKSTVNFDQEPK
jgi:hypothetical protein